MDSNAAKPLATAALAHSKGKNAKINGIEKSKTRYSSFHEF
jgi:hypothetical protein